ncbi:MAG: hypothetical protein LBF83_04830, partial [Spirochaetaceae bacterium]|nr:hypothetical protein [Spirochaetaceae bacterium]
MQAVGLHAERERGLACAAGRQAGYESSLLAPDGGAKQSMRGGSTSGSEFAVSKPPCSGANSYGKPQACHTRNDGWL